MSVGVTDGRLTVLATRHRTSDIRQGPEVVLAAALELVREVLDGGRGRPADGRRDRRTGSGRLPPRRLGVAADHAGLGRLPGPRRRVPRARLPGRARQRRERAGRGGAARRRRQGRPGLPVREDRHRHRLRHRHRRRALPRRRTAAPATSGTSGSRTSGRPAPAATPAASRRSPAARRWPATPTAAPAAAARRRWRRCSRRRASSPPPTSASRSPRATPRRCS